MGQLVPSKIPRFVLFAENFGDLQIMIQLFDASLSVSKTKVMASVSRLQFTSKYIYFGPFADDIYLW